jgi:arabinogalactan oligomer / maltooligosaccharide transport system permease protein
MRNHSKRAGILSLLYMGLGQIYNGQCLKGLLLAALEAIYLFFALPFLARALTGLVTLGTVAQTTEGGKIIQGDHSIYLMVAGILAIIMLIAFIAIYLLNIKDAVNVGSKRMKNIRPASFKTSLLVLPNKGFPYILLLPALFFILLFNVLPLVFGTLVSFTNYSAPNHLPPRNLVNWVGFQNFIDLFTMKTLSTTIAGVSAWTFIWAISATLSTFFFGLIMAVFVNSKGVKIKRFWRTIFIIPWAMPNFISVYIMRNFFNGQFGPINRFLNTMGIEDIPWLTNSTMVKITCILVNLWFGMPYYMAMISGVMTNIPNELYESAKIDGAGPFDIFRKITAPMVTFAIAPLLIMSFGFNFNNFSLIYLLTAENPGNTSYLYAGNSDILISWVFKLTFENQLYSIASAIFVIIFIVISVLSIISLRRTKSFRDEDMMR